MLLFLDCAKWFQISLKFIENWRAYVSLLLCNIYVSEESVENMIIMCNVEYINLALINHLKKTQDKMVILQSIFLIKIYFTNLKF